jgi:hypothetical protein
MIAGRRERSARLTLPDARRSCTGSAYDVAERRRRHAFIALR